jgi:hypothetical protein
MAADQPDRQPAGRQPADRRPTDPRVRLRLRWLIAVVAVMAILTAGWPLLNIAVSDRQPVAAGSALTIGPGAPDAARLRVGPGWYLESDQSNPHRVYSLRRGPAAMSISYAALVGRAGPGQLWPALRRVLQLSHPGARLGRPAAVTSIHGSHGVTGTVSGESLSGVATVYPGPSGNFAIEIVVLVPRSASPVLIATATRMTRSLQFPVGKRFSPSQQVSPGQRVSPGPRVTRGPGLTSGRP